MDLKFKGTLEIYYETGMEHLGLQLYLEGYEIPNEKYDPKNKNSGPEFYHDWSGVIILNPGDKIKIISSPLSKYNNKVFTIGNKELAGQDHYRFGGSYPVEINEIPLIDWYDLFACEKTKIELCRPIKKIAYYGGTFDPFHVGHEEIINQLKYHNDLVLVLPGDNWTKNKPMFSLEQRLNSVKAVYEKASNVVVLDWSKKMDTSSTYRMVKKIEKEYGVLPSVVIGSDNIEKIEKWKNWSLLKKMNFIIFNRSNDNTVFDLSKFEKEPSFWKYFKNKVSSTLIKETNDISLIPKKSQQHLDLTLLKKDNKNEK